ncbi:MAG: AAA family ATPase, partial [Actinomycetota bacterium]|nr:AAA family ATPase [Actinomycetota bacterium]
AWERSGRVVVGCALSARAATELRDGAGIRASTIASLLADLRRGFGLAQGSVLVVDEAGMAGSRALAELAGYAERSGTKLVLVGDDRQLPEIQAGGAFRGLSERLGCVELRSVRRQPELWDREALAALREGEAGRFLKAYATHGRLTLGRTAVETHAALVSDWWEAHTQEPDGDAVMLALRRADVADLNRQARALMREAGALGDDELEVGGRSFCAGDRVVTMNRNDYRLGVMNATRGSVAWVDTGRRELGLRCDDGRELTLPSDYLEEGNLDHGYAQTVHKAQSATVARTFVLGTEESYREWGYTALSRHRVEARFYATAPELSGRGARDADEPDPWEAIERRLGTSRAKELAIDVRDDALRAAPREALEAEAEGLRAMLATYPADAAREEALLEDKIATTEKNRALLDADVARLRDNAPRGWLERRRDPTQAERLTAAERNHARVASEEAALKTRA